MKTRLNEVLTICLVLLLVGCAGRNGLIGVALKPGKITTVVEKLKPNGPADLAGMRSGDVITQINGKDVPLNDVEGLVGIFKSLPVGEYAEFKVLRDGKEVPLQVKVAPRPVVVVTFKSKMDSWLGHDISSWTGGYPSRSFTAPNGNKVHEYNRSESKRLPRFVIPGQTTINPNYGGGFTASQSPGFAFGGGVKTYQCIIWLEVNSRNRIVKWSAQGNSCR